MNYKKTTILLIFSLILSIIVTFLVNKKSSIVKITSITDTGYDQGYGIVYKVNKKTYIITNNHVIEDNNKILINDKYQAKLINTDEYEDIAVLSIKSKNFKKANFNYNTNPKDKVSIISLSNHKALKGNINKINKKILVNLKSGNYLLNTIELNAPIKEGHSGSPLYNTKKEVIGLITMKHKNKKNIGYAIDIKHALSIAKILEKEPISRPNIGVEVASTSNQKVLNKYDLNTYNKQGIIVTKVYSSKKLKVGDIITSINNHKVKDIAHFKYYLYNTKNINLNVYRNNKYKQIIINN